MEPEQSERLEHILGRISVGIAILNCATLRIRYANSYLLTLLAEPWSFQDIIGKRLDEVVPEEVAKAAQLVLQQVCTTRQSITLSDLPYEGFLEARGRTYWRISIEPTSPRSSNISSSNTSNEQSPHETPEAESELLITIEDVTNSVRSRLYLDAVHHISSAIAGPFALPQVLDRILQAVQELVGSTRCAVLLIDNSISDRELHLDDIEEDQLQEVSFYASPSSVSTRTPIKDVPAPTVTIAAQKGLFLTSQPWHQKLSDHLLLGKVTNMRHTLIITDTSTIPKIELPLLDDQGMPRRPGSVLCVPIFEPTPDQSTEEASTFTEKKHIDTGSGSVLGAIEVYHRRARGFPAEEVELLEQFAQQAGLAIQNARFFLRINYLARDAQRSARQQKNVMQAIPDGVIIYDARWRIADANDVIRKLMGWSDDVIGMHVTEVMAHSKATFEGDLPALAELVAKLEHRALERRVTEIKMIGADGRQYTMRRSQAPIHDNLGDIFAFVVVYHDVTEQAADLERIEAEVIARTAELAQRNKVLQEVQAAQQLESARMQLLIERLPSGVMLISADSSRIDLINQRAIELLQRLRVISANTASENGTQQAFTLPFADTNIEAFLRSIPFYGASGSVIPYEDQPLFRALHKDEASEAELHVIEPDGQTLFLLVNAAPLHTSDGRISNTVLVWHDITTLKALERAREDFFTTMAHELKTPLANIRAHLSALQAQDLQWSPQEQYAFLLTADEQVERLVSMINQFLDASRVEAGALRLELEPILLPEMFEDLQDRLDALIASSQRQLQIHAPPDLPAVLADYELIMSVLTNLLSNAFRFAPEGDTVLLEAEPIFAANARRNSRPRAVEIRVSDRGPGISQELQAELFTRFSTFAAQRRPDADRPGQPVHRSSRRWSPATGLGLYISRGIIEAHGSQLRLQSNPGEGATFAFILTVASSSANKKIEQ